MWNKILEINWTTRFGTVITDERTDELIEGTNGATIAKIKDFNSWSQYPSITLPSPCGLRVSTLRSLSLT